MPSSPTVPPDALRRFLDELSRTGSIRDAVRASGVAESRLRKLRREDADLRDRWDVARKAGKKAARKRRRYQDATGEVHPNTSPTELVRNLPLPARLDLLLERLAEGAQVGPACDAAGLTRAQFYRLRRQDPEGLGKRVEEALAIAGEILEDEATRRAVEGVSEPVFYMGEIVGTRQRYSDQLLMFLLRSRLPERYGDRRHVTLDQPGADSAPVDLERLSTAQLRELDRLLLAATPENEDPIEDEET